MMSNYESWAATVKLNKTGELYFEIPEEVLSRLNWKAEDDLDFHDNHDGTFTLTKVVRTNMELDFTEKELNRYMLRAHQEDMSLNKWIEKVLKTAIELDS